MSKLMNQSEYARYKGIDQSTVNKAVMAGKISVGKDGKIDPDIADKEWIANSDPSKRMGAKTKKSQHSDKFEDEQLRKLTADADLREMLAAQKRGELISADEIEKQAFQAGRIFRDAVLLVPHKVANQVAKESDASKCEQIIKKTLADAMRNARK